MRILYITANSYLRSTTSSLNAIIQQLRPNGVEPVMLFREPGPWPKELAAQGTRSYFHSLRIAEKSRPVRSIWDTSRLVRLIRRERIDLIHCNEHELYPAVRLAARWTGLPVVVTLHYKLESAAYASWLFGASYAPAAIQFISKAQLEFSKPMLAGTLTDNRIRLLMSGLDIDAFRARGGDGAVLRQGWQVSSDTVVIGTASAIRPYKHIDQFIRLIDRLRGRGLKVLGLIAGGGRFADPVYETGLRNLIQQLGLEKQCRLLGNLDPLTPFLKAIDVFVSTSEWETFGMSICEAQACGKPTLAYAVGGNPEALPDDWCTVPFGDLDALQEKATRLVTDVAFRRQLAERAEQFVRENFDAPVLAARQAAIYEEILGRSLAPVPEKVACLS